MNGFEAFDQFRTFLSGYIGSLMTKPSEAAVSPEDAAIIDEGPLEFVWGNGGGKESLPFGWSATAAAIESWPMEWLALPLPALALESPFFISASNRRLRSPFSSGMNDGLVVPLEYPFQWSDNCLIIGHIVTNRLWSRNER